MRRIGLVAAVVLLAAAPARAEIDLEDVARDVVRELVDGKYDAAVARFAPELKKAMGRDQVALLVDGLRAERGPCKSVIARMRRDEPDGHVLFKVKANWLRVGTSDFTVRLKADGSVVTVGVGDEAKADDEAARDRYEPKARLRSPVRGAFVVRNASRDASNPHFVVRSQRHAIDLVMIGAGGKTFRDAGRNNEDYLCYGQPVLAPADGTIAVAVDGIPENRPGQKDAMFAPGNLIVIDLGQGEFAVLGHLQTGSVTGKIGQAVHAGDAIAKIGNSGASPEPMLHFQLADKPRLVEAASLPVRFTDATVDGKKQQRATPVEGSRVGE